MRGEAPTSVDNRPQCRRIVQRRKLHESLQTLNDPVVEQHRPTGVGTAVDDPMSDRGELGGRRLERVDDLGGPVRFDERELQARRAGVDDEDCVFAQ
jgi:hypothetical protein